MSLEDVVVQKMADGFTKTPRNKLKIRFQQDGISPEGIGYLVEVINGKDLVRPGSVRIEQTGEGFEIYYTDNVFSAVVRGRNHGLRSCELEIGGRKTGYTAPNHALTAMGRALAKSFY